MSDRRYDEPDPVRWFNALGTCKCGKPATGTLMGPRNESYGVSCSKCADKRIAARKKFYAVAEPPTPPTGG